MRNVPAWLQRNVVGRLTRLGGTRRGKIRRRLLVALVVLLTLIALLPTIVAKTPLFGVLMAKVLPPGIRANVGGASLGWFTAPSLAQIALQDAAGGKLVEIESIRLDRSLLSLVTNQRDLGLVEITRPTLYVAVREDGSNVEDALAPLLAKLEKKKPDNETSKSASDAPAITLRIVEGVVLTDDVVARRQWRLRNLNLQFESRGAAGLHLASLAGRLEEGSPQQDPGEMGRFAIAVAPSEADPHKRELTLKANTVPLAALGPWLRRSLAGAELSGTLSGQGGASWIAAPVAAGALPDDLQSSGQFSIDQLDVAAMALAGDRLRLARVELPWRIASTVNPQGQRGLVIEDMQLRSDVSQLTVRGTIDASATRPDVEARGAINLARLTNMLPHALRIREGTTLTSGVIELGLHEQPAVGGQQLSGTLRTAQIAATSGGRQLRWDAPVSASFAVRRTAAGVLVDLLQCTSEFLTIDGSGTADHFTATARLDLNLLAAQLGQFIDLAGVELAGTGTARAEWHLANGTKFTATAGGDLAQLRVGLGDGSVWAEPQMAVRSSASGTLDPATRQLAHVEEAWVKLSAQGDELDARLAGPVQAATSAAGDSQRQSAAAWPVSIRAVGGAGRWLTRARPWLDLGGWQFDGQSELTANLRVSPSAVGASDTKLVITNLRAENPDWLISEPRVEFTGDARWDGASGAIAADNAQFVTSMVSLALKDLRVGPSSAGGRQASGAVAFRADVFRLGALRSMADRKNPRKTLPAYVPSGRISGNIGFSNQSGRTVAELLVTGENLALSQTPRGVDPRSLGMPTVWQEPKLTIRAAATYDPNADRLALDRAQIESNTLTAAIDGQIEKLSATAEANLRGTLNYDLAQLTPLLRPLLGNGIQLSGREQARFAVAGPLMSANGGREAWARETLAYVSQSSAPAATHWSRRVQARLELPWSGANVYGLPVGGGRLAAALSDGAVRIDPLALAVAEGRLTAAPLVKLDPAPAELSLPAGPLLADVRITPEVSEAMLKYIAPVLAGATQSEGQFSLTFNGARVPLADAKAADAAGQLTVHSVRVVPGAMAKEVIALVQQIETLVKQGNPLSPPADAGALRNERQITLLSIRDQPVNFRVVKGGVEHESMEFQVEDVVVRSQGWVGFDETIRLTFTVPIQDRWVEKQRLLANLRGQSLQIPVTGTLTRPQLDKRALASVSTQLLQGAAGEAVGNELNRALDKIFRPK